MTIVNDLPAKNQFQGEIIDGYQLVEEIGRGKTGVVYKTLVTAIGHTVACKLIPKSKLKLGWEIEIQKVTKLDGIGQIVQYKQPPLIHNFAGSDYLCMFWEYIPGLNLREWIKRNKITLEIFRTIVDEILQAFYAMKQVDISHNDLHEGNIIIYEDERVISPHPRIKITDFGIGGSLNQLVPKDDYRELARICHSLLVSIDSSELEGPDRYFYDQFIDDFIPKKLLEKDPTQGEFVRNPQALLTILGTISEIPIRETEILSNPFDYLRCEQMGNSFKLLQKLYSKNFPGYNDCLQRNNSILTGPRGCGKTTIFKNLSLKAQLLAGIYEGLSENFIGIYYHCYDLYFAFPYTKQNISNEQRHIIIHYFNLSILFEVLDLIEIVNNKNEKLIDKLDIGKIQEFSKEYLKDYQIPPEGANIIKHLKEVVNHQKRNARNSFYLNKDMNIHTLLQMDFISKFSRYLQENIKMFKGKAIYYLLDDYSLPLISKSLQTTVNDFIFFPIEHSHHFFKISTESIVTFYPYTSSNKLLIQNREYILIDLGYSFITADSARIQSFLGEVVNNRLKNTPTIHEMYQNIEAILGENSYKSNNDLARQIRAEREEGTTKKRVLYYGWKTIVDLCSGDVANILELIKTIFNEVGSENFSRLNGVNIPISYSEVDTPKNVHLQDKSIREAGNDFLYRIGFIPEEDYGSQIKQIVATIGHIAYWYLCNIDSKNEATRPPHQACRIELQEDPHLEGELLQIYNNIIKYGIFIRDSRGKSQRGEAVDRLYLRCILIPTFKLTFSKRDSIRLDPNEFKLLLKSPSKFETVFTSKTTNKARVIKQLLDEEQGRIINE